MFLWDKLVQFSQVDGRPVALIVLLKMLYSKIGSLLETLHTLFLLQPGFLSLIILPLFPSNWNLSFLNFLQFNWVSLDLVERERGFDNPLWMLIYSYLQPEPPNPCLPAISIVGSWFGKNNFLLVHERMIKISLDYRRDLLEKAYFFFICIFLGDCNSICPCDCCLNWDFALANQDHSISPIDDVAAIVYQSENPFRWGAASSAQENTERGWEA